MECVCHADLETQAAMLDPFENVVGSFVLINNISDEAVTEEMFGNLLREIFDIFTECDGVFGVGGRAWE